MIILISGLVLFIGVHSFRIFANPARERLIARFGENTWKGVYSLVSLASLVLIIWGYGLSRADPVILWNPPLWTRDVALLLTWIAFILFPAASIPRNHFKQYLGHPMYAGIKIWAFAHLISNGRLEDVVLFGVFLLWSILGFSAARKRDRRAGVIYPQGETKKTVVCIVAGTVVWALFVFVLHRWLIGVSPV
jgi:uncharacterized membrane protein